MHLEINMISAYTSEKILSVPTQQRKQGIRRTKRPFALVIIIHMNCKRSHEHNSKEPQSMTG